MRGVVRGRGGRRGDKEVQNPGRPPCVLEGMVEGGTYGGDQQPANWRSTPTAPPARKRASLQTGHMHDLAELEQPSRQNSDRRVMIQVSNPHTRPPLLVGHWSVLWGEVRRRDPQNLCGEQNNCRTVEQNNCRTFGDGDGDTRLVDGTDYSLHTTANFID